jgi:ATP-binding cassette subfamily F protein 3
VYEGDLDAYRALVMAADRPDAAKGKGTGAGAGAGVTPAVAVAAPVAAKPDGAKVPGPSASTLRRRLEQAEAALEKEQARLADIDRRLADPALFTRDPGGAARLSRERAAAAAAVEAAEEAWLAAGSALEGAR